MFLVTRTADFTLLTTADVKTVTDTICLALSGKERPGLIVFPPRHDVQSLSDGQLAALLNSQFSIVSYAILYDSKPLSHVSLCLMNGFSILLL